MFRHCSLLLLASLAGAAPRFGEVTAPHEVGRNQRLELTFPLQATFENPDDPAQIDVVATFTDPAGQPVKLPAFRYVPFQQTAAGVVEPAGEPVWKVRFTPRQTGAYAWKLAARDATGSADGPTGTFTCLASEADGFVTPSRDNPHYLAYESGRPYLPLGFNQFFMSRYDQPVPKDRLPVLTKFLTRLADAGGNFIRLRADSWWLPLEMTANEKSGYRGIGWYDDRTAWELDQYFDQCEQRGVQLMFCLYNANSTVNLGNPTGRNAWRAAYNFFIQANGGPCESANEIWTDPTATELVQRKLRYCVARWGYSPNLMAWEFFNEVVAKADTADAAVAWHRDLARYLKSIDPWQHPVTSSVQGDAELAAKFWELPEMELAQHHVYRRPDIAGAMAQLASEAWAKWPKPFLFGEFGIGPLETGEGKYDFDPDGVSTHNGLWGSIASGSAGGGFFWYIGGYLDKFDLYHQYTEVRDFAAGFPFTDPQTKPLEVTSVSFATPPATKHPIDFRLPTSNTYGFTESPVDQFVVGPDGRFDHPEALRPFLHCGKGRKTPPTFVFDSPRPWQFVVKVLNSVGDETNQLHAELDGQSVLDQPFPAGPDHGLTQREIPEYHNWACTYQQEVTLDIPAGRHTVKLEATGKDRLEVEYQLRGYLSFEDSRPVDVWGVGNEREGLLWAHSRRSTWHALQQEQEPITLSGLQATLSGWAEGEYEVTWWDTWTGRPTQTVTATARDHTLVLDLPELTRDVGARFRRK